MRKRLIPPAAITPDVFREFRSPRRGAQNPEPMTNPFWVWLIEDGVSAYRANEAFDGPRSEEAGPCWSWDRYGRSETTMPDGRVISIGGEHEDFYDPDFYIHNDVVVADPSGRREVLCYSEEAFPPTDFHTATLAGHRIVVIGSLSYPHLRKECAQVLVLDTHSYAFDRINTSGASPPWLHKHSAELSGDGKTIVVRGGLIHNPQWPSLIENIDDWLLDLGEWRWERLTRRAWPRFLFVRADGAANHLYKLRDLVWARVLNRPDRFADKRAELLRDLGLEPRLDLFEALYAPAIAHAKLPEREDEFRVHRISVDDVVVRYVESDYDVGLTVEGDLPRVVIELLRDDLLRKLEAIENARIDCTPVISE